MATLDILKKIAAFQKKRQTSRNNVEIMLALKFDEEE